MERMPQTWRGTYEGNPEYLGQLRRKWGARKKLEDKYPELRGDQRPVLAHEGRYHGAPLRAGDQPRQGTRRLRGTPRSIYDEKPWLSRYDQDQPAEISLEFTDALAMFWASVSRNPDGDIIRYFGGRIIARSSTSSVTRSRSRCSRRA